MLYRAVVTLCAVVAVPLVLYAWKRGLLPRHWLQGLLLAPPAKPKRAAKKPTEPTTLLLVRHGQSMHNISSVAEHSDTGADESLYDAPLSPLGKQQVAALAGHEELATAELIITSPLTRAVQTLYGAFPRAPSDCPAPVEVWALAAEHLTDSCDIGSGASALAKVFPRLAQQFRTLPEVWWYTDEETSKSDALDSRNRFRDSGFMEPELTLIHRVAAFADEIRARPEQTIAVFGHSDYFNFLMENHCAFMRLEHPWISCSEAPFAHRPHVFDPRVMAPGGVSDYWLENAEVYRVVLPPKEES